MKTLKLNLLFALIAGVLVFGCERKCDCSPPPLASLVGVWKLTHITYSSTQRTVTSAEAGYTETLSFLQNGTYNQVRSNQPLQTGGYSVLFPNGGSTEGQVLYRVPNQQEKFEQSFKLDKNDKRLIMTERKPVTVAIADGSTYEYQRQ